MQKEYLYPEVGDRQSPDDWIDAGATSAAERAREVVEATLAGHYPTHLSPAVDAAIRERLPILLDARALTGADGRW